jgi:hypothetical protein
MWIEWWMRDWAFEGNVEVFKKLKSEHESNQQQRDEAPPIGRLAIAIINIHLFWQRFVVGCEAYRLFQLGKNGWNIALYHITIKTEKQRRCQRLNSWKSFLNGQVNHQQEELQYRLIVQVLYVMIVRWTLYFVILIIYFCIIYK